jgi:hypothetical protein
MAVTGQSRRGLLPRALAFGALAGIVSGVTFALFEMIVTAGMGGPFVMPLRMIAAIALGGDSLEAAGSLASVLAVGAVVHLALSAIYGVVFAAIVFLAHPIRRNLSATVLAGGVYGLLLWLVNFYLISPLAFPWFQKAPPLVQFFAHIIFFGAVLGVLTATRLPLPVQRDGDARGRPTVAGR